MLVTAMDAYQVAKRQHKDNVKNQHNVAKGSKGEKTYFRASEMGNDDRKIIYSFFAHQLPKVERKAKNLRQLENGDFVHDRYQSAWLEMGISISQEVRVTSRNDEYLKQFPWEWAGHYDGELDINIIRAFATGNAKVDSVFNEGLGEWEVVVDINDQYAAQIGLFAPDGTLSPTYQPLRMVADIKTINPYGFKAIKDKHDLTKVSGYLDQIMFYMYMLQTPYGSIYFESKDNNDVVEVQILWEDFYEGMTLDFQEDIHGKQHSEVVRAKVRWGRFLGDETQEGAVPRLTRLHDLKEALVKADAAGDMAALATLMPQRCADDPKGFPCSWGHKNGAEHVQYCEFYDHCWNQQHHGLAVKDVPPVEACPPEAIWTFEDDTGEVRIDSRKVPAGVNYDAFLNLVQMNVLDYRVFIVDDVPAGALLPPSVQETIAATAAESTAMNGSTELFNPDGTLRIGEVSLPSEAQEHIGSNGDKAILCTNCGKEQTYKRLGNGGTKKCESCGHANKVKKM